MRQCRLDRLGVGDICDHPQRAAAQRTATWLSVLRLRNQPSLSNLAHRQPDHLLLVRLVQLKVSTGYTPLSIFFYYLVAINPRGQELNIAVLRSH
jgi:hypothetical protein